MKRILKSFIVLFVMLLSLCLLKVYANGDNSTNLILSNEVSVKSYEMSSSFDYSLNNRVELMSYGKKSIGSFSVFGVSSAIKKYNGFEAYSALENIYFSYSYDSSYLDTDNKWHMVNDKETTVLGNSLSSAINYGVLIIEQSSDLINWSSTITPITDYFSDYYSGEKIYSISNSQLKLGMYYRAYVLYSLESDSTTKRFIECYEFYIFDSENSIEIKSLSNENIDYTYNNCNITSSIVSNTLMDNAITTKGFYISKNGYNNHIVTVKKDNESAITIDGFKEFKEAGSYTINIYNPIGEVTTKTIYVYNDSTNYGYNYYFDGSIIKGNLVYSNDKIIYGISSKLYINEITHLKINGELINITKNEIISINEFDGNIYYDLSPGDYIMNLSCGSDSGEILTYNYEFTISSDISKPGYNYNIINNMVSNYDLILKHYEVDYNNIKIVFDINNYNSAYSYAYKIEKSLVEYRTDGYYYKSIENENIIKYDNNDKLDAALSYYANKRIEISYFDDEFIKIEAIPDLFNNLDYLNHINVEYVVSSDIEKNLYYKSYILNDYTYDYVSDYDSISVQAYCHENKEYYDIEFEKPLSEQLPITSRYTMIEKNIYGYYHEYSIYYAPKSASSIDLNVYSNGIEERLIINTDNAGYIDADYININSISNSIISNSIMIIESSAYTYPLKGYISEFNNLGLYKAGSYKITCIDSLSNSFVFNVNISGKCLYKDVINSNIKSYTDMYNDIYLNNKELVEELMYDRLTLIELCNRQIDICKYTYSTYTTYYDSIAKARILLANSTSTDNEINLMGFELVYVYNSLVRTADKTMLYNEIILYESINSSLYVSNTYKNYNDEYIKSLEVFKSDSITKEDVIKYSTSMKEKYNNLVLRGDKTYLKNMYDMVSDLKLEDYTPKTYSLIMETSKIAKGILDDIDADQAMVDDVLKRLHEDYKCLVFRADYSELVKLLEDIEKISEWKYTTSAIDNLHKHSEYAREIYKEQNATQVYVNQLSFELNELCNNLEECGDQTLLHDIVVEISKLHTSIYTTETIKPLMQKYEEANIIISQRHTQKTIDELYDEIHRLFISLVIREDKEKLYYKLIEFSNIDYSSVSSSNMKSFMKVYNAAYDVLYAEDSSEDEINKAYNDLVSANEKIFEEVEFELVSPWVIIIVSLASLLALVLANGLMKEVFDCEFVGLLILWIPSIIALPLLFLFTPLVGGVILLIELGIIILFTIIGILVDVNI